MTSSTGLWVATLVALLPRWTSRTSYLESYEIFIRTTSAVSPCISLEPMIHKVPYFSLTHPGALLKIHMRSLVASMVTSL